MPNRLSHGCCCGCRDAVTLLKSAFDIVGADPGEEATLYANGRFANGVSYISKNDVLRDGLWEIAPVFDFHTAATSTTKYHLRLFAQYGPADGYGYDDEFDYLFFDVISPKMNEPGVFAPRGKSIIGMRIDGVETILREDLFNIGTTLYPFPLEFCRTAILWDGYDLFLDADASLATLAEVAEPTYGIPAVYRVLANVTIFNGGYPDDFSVAKGKILVVHNATTYEILDDTSTLDIWESLRGRSWLTPLVAEGLSQENIWAIRRSFADPAHKKIGMKLIDSVDADIKFTSVTVRQTDKLLRFDCEECNPTKRGIYSAVMPTSDPDPETADTTALAQIFLDYGFTSATFASRAAVVSFNSETFTPEGSRVLQKRWRYTYNTTFPGNPPGTSTIDLWSFVGATAEEDPAAFSITHRLNGCLFRITANFISGSPTIQRTVPQVTLDPDAVARATYDPDDLIVVPDVSATIDVVGVAPWDTTFGIVFPDVTFNATTEISVPTMPFFVPASQGNLSTQGLIADLGI